MTFKTYFTTKLLNILLKFGSLILFLIRALSRHFSKIFISISANTLLLKPKAMPEQKYPDNLVLLIAQTLAVSSNSSKIERSSLFCIENKSSFSSTDLQEWSVTYVELVHSTGGLVSIQEVLLFASLTKFAQILEKSSSFSVKILTASAYGFPLILVSFCFELSSFVSGHPLRNCCQFCNSCLLQNLPSTQYWLQCCFVRACLIFQDLKGFLRHGYFIHY